MNSYILILEYMLGIFKSLFHNNGIVSFKVNGRSMHMSSHSFKPLFRHIFLEKDYELPELSNAKPKILDIGANVGMSIWFFKSKYPACEIEGIEADPDIFTDLERNVSDLKDCKLHNFAAWQSDGSIQFSQTGMLGGKINSHDIEHRKLSVKTVDIKKWMGERSFDVIKIDIEGAEKVIIPHAIEHISKAKIVIFEWHKEYEENPDLHSILKLFADRGFNYYIRAEDRIHNPFLKKKEKFKKGKFTNRLISYCWKDIEGFS